MTAKLAFGLLSAVALFLALTPGPLGGAIESSLGRHALAFAVLPAIGAAAFPRLPLALHFLFYVVAGGAIEIAQWTMGMGRTASWDDWAIDCLCAAAVLTCIYGVRALKNASAA